MKTDSKTVFEIVNRTIPYLREGLGPRSAAATARAIHDVADISTVAVTDRERILAFVGEGVDHHMAGRPIMTVFTKEAIRTGIAQAVHGIDAIGCPVPTCTLRAAMVAPLRSHGQIVGTLKFYNVQDRAFSEKELRFAGGLSQMLSLELELAQIDIQKQLATQAELQALQAQISPHFLFNTLNTIASFCREDAELAEELLVEFADLFRRNLRHYRGLVTLQEELEFVDSYLRFEQYRFGDRLNIERDHQPEARSARIPPLTLQPIVENAIAHGVNSRLGVSTVLIQSRVRGGDVLVAVEDDGVGMDPELFLRGDFGGIGLWNVQRRLQGVFGPEYGLSIRSQGEGGTRVEIRFPKRVPLNVFPSATEG